MEGSPKPYQSLDRLDKDDEEQESKLETKKTLADLFRFDVLHEVHKAKDEGGLHDLSSKAKWRIILGEWLEGHRCQSILAILLLLDVFCVVVELLIGANIIRNETEVAKEAQHVLHLISLTILFIFAVEVSLLVVAFGIQFFKHFWYVLDFIVIFLSIILDLTLHTDEAELLLIIRAWRIVRILHGIYTYREIEHKEKEKLIKKLADLERKLEDERAYTTELEKKYGIPPRKRDHEQNDYNAHH